MTEYIVRIPPDMPYEIRAELNAWYIESEPIVRCRDCKYGINSGNTCIEGAYEPEYWRPVEPDGFCKWGERKRKEVDE